jgi:hypothetical protein
MKNYTYYGTYTCYPAASYFFSRSQSKRRKATNPLDFPIFDITRQIAGDAFQEVICPRTSPIHMM